MGNSGAAVVKTPSNGRLDGWSTRSSLTPLENTPSYRGHPVSDNNRSASVADTASADSFKTVIPDESPCGEPQSRASSPYRTGSLSPTSSQKDVFVGSPRSSI